MKKIYLLSLLVGFLFWHTAQTMAQTITATDVPFSLCENESFTMRFTLTGTPTGTYTYTAELSDETGSFTSPTSIGSVVSSTTTEDYIYCTIPLGITLSPTSKYRIRVTTADYTANSVDNGSDIVINCTTRDYYWTGGSGNWSDLNHWQVTTDGVTFSPASEMPTQYDNVNFDNQSFPSGGQLTIDVTADCNDFEWEPGSGASKPVLWADSYPLNVYGDFVLDPGVYRDIRYIYFKAIKYNVTVNLADNLFQKDPNVTFWQGGDLYFAGSGSWDLESDVVAENLKNNGGGTLNTADYNITLESELYNTSDFNAGASIITLNRLSNYAVPGSFDAGTSVFQFVLDKNSTIPSISGSQTYYQVYIISGICNISGSNTYNSLQVLGEAGINLNSGTTQTITSELVLQGNSRSELAIVESQTPGTQATLYVAGASVTANYVSIIDNIIDDGVAGIYPAINAIDGGNNSGWDFSTSPLTTLEYYWVNGTGNWSDVSHWTTSTDGGITTVPATEGPAFIDNVNFNSNSFPTGGVLTIDKAVAVINMIWEPGSGITLPEIKAGYDAPLTIYGDFVLDNGVKRTIASLYFDSSKNPNNIAMASDQIPWGTIYFQGGGTWNLQDTLYNEHSIYIYDGTFNSNGFPVICNDILQINDTSPVINWDASEIYLNRGLQIYTSTPVFNIGNSVLIFGTDVSSNNFLYSQYAGTFAANILINGTLRTQSDITTSNLTITPGGTLSIRAGNTFTVTDTLNAVGTRSELSNINSDTPGTLGNLQVTGAIVNVDFVSIQDNQIDNGLPTDVLATNAIDNGNTPGWSFSGITPLDYRWVGGPGNWSDLSHWESSPLGAGTYVPASDLPGQLDNVYFTTTSFPNGGLLNIDVNAACKDFIWESGSGSNFPLIQAKDPVRLSIYGSFILDNGVTRDIDFLRFEANSPGQVIDMADNLMVDDNKEEIIFNGTGSWSLQDSLSTYRMTIRNGSLTTNSNPVAIRKTLYIDFNHAGTILLGSSNVYLEEFYNRSASTVFDAGSSTMWFKDRATTSSRIISDYPGLISFNNVVLMQDGNFGILDDFTYNNLTIEAGALVGLQSGSTQTIINSFTALGKRSKLIEIYSSNPGTAATLMIDAGAGAVIDVSYLSLQDNTLDNGLATDQPANLSIDMGNNTGWDFLSNPLVGLDYYWVGGSGNWSDVSHWASDVDGISFHTEAPGIYDNVNFTDNSFPTGGNVSLDQPAFCRDMVWTNGMRNPTIEGNAYPLTIGGSLIIADGVITNVSPINFVSDNNNQILMGDNRFSSRYLTFSGNGTWNIMDSLAADGIQINSGTINTNDNPVTIEQTLSLYGADTIRLNLGKSTIQLGSYTNYAANAIIDAGTSNLVINQGITGDLNTYNLTLQQSVSIAGNLTVDNDLILEAGTNLALTPGYSYTIVGDIIVNSTRSQPVSIVSTQEGVQATLTKSAGTVNANYIILKDNNAAGGADFNAFNAIDQGNVTGWTLNSITPVTYYWSTGSGNWNDVNSWSDSPTSISVPSSPPGPVDNIIIKSNSPIATGGTITLDIPVVCNSITIEANVNNVTFDSKASNDLTISSSLAIDPSANIVLSNIENLFFINNTTNNVIGIGGQDFSNLELSLSGGGQWLLIDSVNIGSLNIENASLNSQDYTIRTQIIAIGDSGLLSLGNSQVYVEGGNIATNQPSGIDAGTSEIYLTNADLANTAQFYNVTVAGKSRFMGSNTFNTLTFLPGADIVLNSDSTQTVNQLIAKGKRSLPIIIRSSIDGQQAHILQPANAVAGEYLYLQDNNAIGGATFAAVNSIDNGNVTGWNITPITSRSYYWVGGSGNWSDAANHWVDTDNGVTFYDDSPGPLDNVFFTSNSFPTDGTLTLDQPAWVNNMDWTGNTSSVSITNNNIIDNTLTIGGSLTLSNGVSRDFDQLIFLSGQTGNTIFMADNLHSNNRVTFSGKNAEWSLTGDFSAQTTVFNNGTFNSNNFKFSSEYISLNNGSQTNWGTSEVNVVEFSNNLNNNGSFNSENSTFVFSATTKSIEIKGKSRFYIAILDGNATILSNNIFFNATFKSGKIKLAKNQSFNTLNVDAGVEVTIAAESTQTISESLRLNGTELAPVVINSSNPGEAGIFSAQVIANISADYVHLQDNTALGGADFTATNSSDFGNVTGWNGLLSSQTITFPPISDQNLADGSFSVTATASSNLPVTFSIASGNATVSGNTITPGSGGLLGIRAQQAGDATFGSAKPVIRYVHIDITNAPNELGNMKEANIILGQPDAVTADKFFSETTLPEPSDVVVVPFLADGSDIKQMLAVTNGNRVSIWYKMPADANTPADVVLGQPDFNTSNEYPNPSASTFVQATLSIAYAQGFLFVSDYGRVLAFNVSPNMQNGQAASLVIGQPDFNTAISGVSSTQFSDYFTLVTTYDQGANAKLIVSDFGNNRVLIYNQIPTSNGAAADVVVGQPDFTSSDFGNGADQLSTPAGTAVSPDGKLLIADFGNNRVLVYNTIPTTNGAAADLVLGQVDFGYSDGGVGPTSMRMPTSVSVSRTGKLAITDFGNNRILIYNSIPTDNTTAPDIILGQPDANSNTANYNSISGRTLNEPYSAEWDISENLIVADLGNNRVLVYGAADLEAPQASNLSVPTTIVSGASNPASVTLTDRSGVLEATLTYRGLSSSSSAYQANPLTGDPATGNYTVEVPLPNNEQLGLDYYIVLKDGLMNIDTIAFTKANIRYPNGLPVSNFGVGNQQNQYRITAIPLELDSKDAVTVFDEITAGTYDNKKIRMFSWPGGPSASTSYAEYGNGFTDMNLGAGYFTLAASSASVLSGAGETPKVGQNGPVTINLVPGWNLIGNPYNFTVSWSDIQTASGITDAEAQVPQGFNGSFFDANTLGAGEGAFVFNPTSNNVTLTIPITNNAGGRISEAHENTNPLSADSWEIRLLRTDEEGYETQLAAVGMAEDALYSYDKYDRVQPPAIAETPRMVVSHPEFFEPAFQKDIRTTKNYEKWVFTYTGPVNSSKEEVIYWDNSYFGADAPPVYLLDKTRFKVVDMRQQDTYSFVNGGTTEFEIHFGEGALEALLPEDVLFTTPYPNPFSTVVNFNIGLPSATKEYQVQVDIYNTMGQQITSLQASDMVGGYYNFSWNGLDEKGQAVPHGVYIYRMTIAGENSRVVSGKIIKQ